MIRIFRSTVKARSALHCLFLLLYSCSPQGQIVRQLHAPHKTYIDHKKGPDKESASLQADMRGTPGLPASCQTKHIATKQLCFTCPLEDVLILRCIAYKGHFSSEQDCVYDRDHIKCLLKNGPVGLSISLRRPSEKLIRENFNLWEDAVWSIWESRLEQQDYEKMSELLRFLHESSLWLSQRSPDAVADHEIIALLPFPAEQNAKLVVQTRQVLRTLQQARESGHLTLELFLKQWRDFMKAQGYDSNVIQVLDALNLNGLEEVGTSSSR